MKKLLLVATLMIAVLLPLAGCGSSKSADDAGKNKAVAERVFTKEELAHYNGKNGEKAYVAIDGVVYDVTNAPKWKNGEHKGYSAGQDLTKVIKMAPHGKDVLGDLPVVGKMKE